MRMSEVLDQLAATPGDRLTVRTIFATLGDHSISLMVLLLALPNCIPMPPPIATISSLLLFFVAIQIGIGRGSLWMPDIVLRQSIAKVHIDKAIDKALPWVRRLESISRPRWQLIGEPLAAPLTALLVGVLAIGMFTAAPVIGQIPFGLAIGLIGLALVEGDGAVLLAGMMIGAIGLVISASFAFAIIVAIREWF